MNLLHTAPTGRRFTRFGNILMALLCGLVFTAMAGPESAFAAETTDEDTQLIFSVTPSVGHTVTGISGDAGDGPFDGSASASGNVITYDPDPDFSGSDFLHYVECDGSNVCNKVKVDITVNPVNDAPIAVDDPAAGLESFYTLPEDKPNGKTVSAANGLLSNDSDIDSASLTASLDTAPSHGSVVVEPNGKFTYVPDENFHGTDSFTYIANDGTLDSLPATVFMTITSVTDPISLTIPLTQATVLTPANTLLTVPVHLEANGEEVVGLNFDLNYDNSCLVPSPNIPNAVTFQPQAGSAILLVSEPSAGIIRFAMSDGSLVPLLDGHIASVVFEYVNGCSADPLTSSEIWFSNINGADSNTDPLADATTNSHSIDLKVNTAPEDITRLLEYPSSIGSGLLSEGVISETHFANLRTIEMSPEDPEFSAGPDAVDHVFSKEDAGCNGAINDNGMVNLQGPRNSELHFNSLIEIDFETKDRYLICVRSTDPHGAFHEKRLTIKVDDKDEAPTAIDIDNTEIAENMAETLIGTLTTTDTDAIDTLSTDHDYFIVAVTDASSNAVPTSTFIISGTLNDELWTGLSCCDHEESDTYDVTIRSVDVHDPEYVADPTVQPPTLTLFVEQVVTVVITDVNEKPGGIAPTDLEVDLNAPVGTQVGVFTTTDDPDLDDTHTYAFCNSPGGADNSKFQLNSATGELTTNDFMKLNQSPYSICVRTTDNGTPPLSVKKNVMVTVIDGNHAPVAVNDTLDPNSWIAVGSDLYSISGGSITYYSPANIPVLDNDTDVDGDIIKVKVPGTNPKSTTANGEALYSPGSIAYSAPTTGPAAGVDTFTYNVKDSNNASSASPATVTLNYVMEHDLGDCNGDGTLNSQDFVMGIQEYFESSSTNWYEINTEGNFAGSPWGCNTIRDLNINIPDVVCTVRTFLGEACGTTVQASSVQDAATLSIGTDLVAASGQSIAVPINFSNNGSGAAIGFFVDIDTAHFAFDATDADGNGIPDAISFNQSADLLPYVSYNASTGEIKIAAYNVPFRALPDGTLATVNLTVLDGADVDSSDIQLTSTSLSDENAVAVPINAVDGNVNFDSASTGGQSQIIPELYLPLLIK